MEKLGGGGGGDDHHHDNNDEEVEEEDEEKITISTRNKDLSSGDHQGCGRSSRSSELSEEDEEKMDKFYALIARSYRDLARDLRPAPGIRRSLMQPGDIYVDDRHHHHLNEEEGGRRKGRRCSSDNNNNNNEKKRRRIGSGASASADDDPTAWIPTFEWEDFADHGPVHFKNNYSLPHSARSHQRDPASAAESFQPPPPSLPTNDAKEGSSSKTGGLELDLTLRL